MQTQQNSERSWYLWSSIIWLFVSLVSDLVIEKDYYDKCVRHRLCLFTVQSRFSPCYNSQNTHQLLSHMAFSVQCTVDVLSLITDQRITIDMAIQQLQQLTPHWWTVGEAAGMQRPLWKRFSYFRCTFSSLYIHMFIVYEDNFWVCQIVYTTMCAYSLSSRYWLTTRGMRKRNLRRWCTRSSYLITRRGPSWLVSATELGLLTWPLLYWTHTPLVRLTVSHF